MNRVTLMGRLGNSVDVHYFEGGGCVGKCSLATSETYKKKDTGEKVTNTEWHNLVFYNKSAELAAKYLVKGMQLLLEGKITTRKWEASDGTPRYTTEIRVSDFTMLGSKAENEELRSKNGDSNNEAQPANQNIGDDPDDDLPF